MKMAMKYSQDRRKMRGQSYIVGIADSRHQKAARLTKLSQADTADLKRIQVGHK